MYYVCIYMCGYMAFIRDFCLRKDLFPPPQTKKETSSITTKFYRFTIDTKGLGSTKQLLD